MRRENDIKAPDGFLLGGIRRVSKAGTILFQRGYWQCPIEWAGQRVWVHEYYDPFDMACSNQKVKAWWPGERIWSQGAPTLILERTERRDAKPGYRDPIHIAWHNRNAK